MEPPIHRGNGAPIVLHGDVQGAGEQGGLLSSRAPPNRVVVGPRLRQRNREDRRSPSRGWASIGSKSIVLF